MNAPTNPRRPTGCFALGDRVELVDVPPSYLRFAIAASERGTVEFTDSLGTVHVKWDSGARCGIIAEVTDMIRAAVE